MLLYDEPVNILDVPFLILLNILGMYNYLSEKQQAANHYT